MVLVHVIALLRRLLRTVFGTFADAAELRRTLSHRYPLASE